MSIQDPTNDLIGYSQKIELINHKNSCYVNVIIQLFLHSHHLFKLLKKYFGYNLLTKIREIYCDENGISLTEQCDAVLFLNFILDKFNEKCNKINKMSEWRQLKKSKLKCIECGHKNSKEFSENVWICYPNNDEDLCELLINQSDQLVEYRCEKCGITTIHKKMERILNSPTNLFINLQNFRGKKLQIHQQIELNDQEYSLVGIVKHIGTHSNGHYTIYLLDTDGWTLYNDDKITKSDIDKILQSTNKYVNYPLLWYYKKFDREE